MLLLDSPWVASLVVAGWLFVGRLGGALGCGRGDTVVSMPVSLFLFLLVFQALSAGTYLGTGVTVGVVLEGVGFFFVGFPSFQPVLIYWAAYGISWVTLLLFRPAIGTFRRYFSGFHAGGGGMRSCTFEASFSHLAVCRCLAPALATMALNNLLFIIMSFPRYFGV